jgi:hypothetical protein
MDGARRAVPAWKHAMAVASAAYDDMHFAGRARCIVLSRDQRPAGMVEDKKSRRDDRQSHLLPMRMARWRDFRSPS